MRRRANNEHLLSWNLMKMFAVYVARVVAVTLLLQIRYYIRKCYFNLFFMQYTSCIMHNATVFRKECKLVNQLSVRQHMLSYNAIARPSRRLFVATSLYFFYGVSFIQKF